VEAQDDIGGKTRGMDYREEFLVKPGTSVKLRHFDPAYTCKDLSKDEAAEKTQSYCKDLKKLQLLLYAEKKHALLIVLQGLDAAGKDGTINHVISAMNVQGTNVTSFKEPTGLELEHDFLWRVHSHAPAQGTVAIFNRSHYEDVLVARVHHLVPSEEWSKRYALIDDFEKLLHEQNNTRIVKFFLHISPEEQLARFKERLDDPARNWKISESDYTERKYWDDYVQAYEEVFERTSTERAPWYIIPSNHKWFRNLAVSQILAATLEDMNMKMPQPRCDLDMMRKQYHSAEADPVLGS
jgi:PPK2 family polyphosphate:nucleotide phosphotransferase